jgi:uncharacterized protein with von Willebrand factor type A (vWA) domain
MRLARLTASATLALALLGVPFAVEAQPAGKVSQVGLLLFGARSSESSSVEAFMAGLRELATWTARTWSSNFVRRGESGAARRRGRRARSHRRGGNRDPRRRGIRAAKRATGTVPIVVALTAISSRRATPPAWRGPEGT